MILTTTSKDPTKEMRKKMKELSKMIPHSSYQPRGSRPIDRMVELARREGYTRLIILDKKNNLKGIDIHAENWQWMPKSINIKDIKIINKKFCCLKCKDKFLKEFFDIEDEDSEFKLVYDNKIEVI